MSGVETQYAIQAEPVDDTEVLEEVSLETEEKSEWFWVNYCYCDNL